MSLVPTVKDFDDQEYLTAPELEKLAFKLISAESDYFGWILSLRMAYLWKKKAGKSRNKVIAGQVQRTPKLLRHFVSTDYIIHVAANLFEGIEHDHISIERIVYHELLHLIPNNKKPGQAKLQAHDKELFFREIQKYGDEEVTLK